MKPLARRTGLTAVGTALVALSACHQPATPSTTHDLDRNEPLRIRSTTARTRTAPIILRPDETDSSRWLFTETVRDGTAGGWTTGTFDPRRNKIDVKAKNVTGFAIDTSGIAIDWKRVVIISIDGRNSELRRRNFNVLHFRLDDHNRWVVLEP